jgi:hypothetical protein
MKAIQGVFNNNKRTLHSGDPMSGKEAERDEMKDETHELDDMEQDDLDEDDDSKDEAS